MVKDARRIGEIKNIFKHQIQNKDKIKLECSARTCPISRSLHQDLKENIDFIYP